MKMYELATIMKISLFERDVITTSWQLPEISTDGASATDATEAVGVATNY